MQRIFWSTYYVNYYVIVGKILGRKLIYTNALKDAKGIISCYEDFNNGFKL